MHLIIALGVSPVLSGTEGKTKKKRNRRSAFDGPCRRGSDAAKYTIETAAARARQLRELVCVSVLVSGSICGSVCGALQGDRQVCDLLFLSAYALEQVGV